MSRAKVGIVNYGLGNIFSIKQALATFGVDASVTSDPAALSGLDALILPGVGAFGRAMDNLKGLRLVEPLRAAASSSKPMFGICLGMQLFMSASEEYGEHDGLDLIPGRVVRFPERVGNSPLRVPTIGWNSIHPGHGSGWGGSPLAALAPGAEFYFVHSYYVRPQDDAVMLARTSYQGFEYCSALRWRNLFATQFHPEKSSAGGLAIIRAWLDSLER